jgi:hypothetical protein
MACFLNISISVGGRRDGASVARIPVGRFSKAFCSSVEGERRDLESGWGTGMAAGEVSERFFGRPRSMIEEAPSDSPRRWPKGEVRAEVGTSDWFREWELVVVLGE